MIKEPPEKVSQEEITFKVKELEPILSGPKSRLLLENPFEPVYVTLKDGSKLVARHAKLEEAPELLKYVKQFLDVDRDFYDIVGARVYAEILGWYRSRLKDPYIMLGTIDGNLCGFADGRIMSDKINISLHTMAFKRGLRIGAIMYYIKCHYTFDILGQDEYWATYESYNGYKRWGIGMAQPSYPWPDYQHELGGARVYYVTKEYWETTVKEYLKQITGVELISPVPEDLLKKNEKLIIPDKIEV